MTNPVKQNRISRGRIRYYVAHPSYGSSVRTILISTTTQEDVLVSPEPEIGGGKIF
jgi:hypothetical protein